MSKHQVILLAVGVLAMLLLFQLPRIVVENDQLQEVSSVPNQHLSIPSDVAIEISELRFSLEETLDNEKKVTFAYTLATKYLDYGILDSAVYYASIIQVDSNSNIDKVADIYYKAFERSINQEDARHYAKLAGPLLEQLLRKEPTNLSVKNMWAMTLVSSENPMAGITVLKDIISQDENNRQALLNLGLLSIKSNQYERAKRRFEKLVELRANDHESKLYLAITLIELEKKGEATHLLNEIIASKDSIPAIKMLAGDYLKQL